MDKYIEIIEREYHKINFDKYVDDETGSECIWIDIDNIEEDVIDKYMRLIDIYPKKMEYILPLDLEQLNPTKRYEKIKFLKLIMILTTYSENIIIDTNYLNNKHYMSISNNSKLEKVDRLGRNMFTLSEIDYDNNILAELINLSLEESLSISLYLVDIKMIIDVSGLSSLIYNEALNLELIEKITNVEGLYLRKYE